MASWPNTLVEPVALVACAQLSVLVLHAGLTNEESRDVRLGKKERAAKRLAFLARAEAVRKARKSEPKKIAGVPYRWLSGSPVSLSAKSPRFRDAWNTGRPERPWNVPAALRKKDDPQ